MCCSVWALAFHQRSIPKAWGFSVGLIFHFCFSSFCPRMLRELIMPQALERFCASFLGVFDEKVLKGLTTCFAGL